MSTLIGAGVAGLLLWLASQWGHDSTGGYWAAMGVVAGAGLVLGLSQLRGRDGHPPATFGLAFVPVLIAAGWTLIAMQPDSNWFRDHVASASRYVHILGVMRDVGVWNGVLAFGIGLVFGFALEPATLRRRRVVHAPAAATPATAPVATHDARAADEPLTAERRTVDDGRALEDERVVERETTTHHG
ncbi:MAG TPA: hypothetical protein VF186_07670 [Gaiellaceae bacterium]|jgi:hypothetical protein